MSFEKTTFADPPHKFEAGTPNIAGFIGLGAALDYVEAIGRDRIAAYERDLLVYATTTLKSVPGLRLFGEAPHKAAVLSFLIDGIHAHDLATLLDHEGIAVRGHHCAHPLMYSSACRRRREHPGVLQHPRRSRPLRAAIGRVRKLLG